MKTGINFFFITAFILITCCCSELKTNESKVVSLNYSDSVQIRIDSLLKKSFPVMGYRFVITGHFNDDLIEDTLVEHYTDSLQKNEVAKYDTAFDYFDSWFLADMLDKKSFLSHKYNSFQELKGGILGFIYIENCGDVNGDELDDLFVVPHSGGASNCVQGHFYALKDSVWEKLWSIPVWQWQFPDTPEAAMVHGLFGSYDVGHCINDSINSILEYQLKKHHFVKQNLDQSIEYECRNPLDYEEMDSLSERYGQQELILKRFKPVTIDHKLYLQDLKHKNTFYGNVTHVKVAKEWVYLFAYDDPATTFTVRIYYKK